MLQAEVYLCLCYISFFSNHCISVFVRLCICALYFVALLVILSLLLVIVGGQHDGLVLSCSSPSRPSFTVYNTHLYFLWQINSAAAAAAVHT